MPNEKPKKDTYRLNQFLSRCGTASRRKAEELILSGEVTVNQQVADHPGIQIDPHKDLVQVRGKTIGLAPGTTLILHKPKGVICTRSDPGNRKTIYDLLPRRLGVTGIQSIGRLDFDSSGLLILTNDGDLHSAMEHPSHEIERVYLVKARGILDRATKRRFLDGVDLEDGPARALGVKVLRVSGGVTRLELTLAEGRNREVRRLCEAVGLAVLDLKRIRFGAIHLDQLPPGKWRDPTSRESAFFEKIKKYR